MDKSNLISAAAGQWTENLLDRSGRNPLLYYRDLRRGTLNLSVGPDSDVDAPALAKLLDGSKTRLSRLFGDAARLKEAARRARAIAAKAKENDEERGVRTLFLAWGLTTWTNPRTSGPGSSSTPSAPLLLTPLEMKSRGGAAEDFDLQISGEWEVNPTLLHQLAADFDFRADEEREDDFPTERERSDLADRLIGRAQGDIPDFRIDRDKVVVGNFSYQKLAMVKDIKEAGDSGFLGDHELLAAIAGDTDSQTKIRNQHVDFTPDHPDIVHPSEEFLILDADSSQSGVINTVVSGRDLVVEGPPGRGKSQTIANLIAALVANKQWVLFVAEKRAAIDAVLKRLHNIDLEDIVLDLHETGAKSLKRRVAADLRNTLDRYSNSQEPDVHPIHEDLSQHRTSLNQQTASLHLERFPWGESAYGVQAALIDLRSRVEPSHIRLQGDVLRSLAGDTWKKTLDDLKRYVDLEGLQLLAENSGSTNPWGPVYQAGTVATQDDVSATLEALRFLDQHLGSIVAQWGRFAEECRLRPPDTFTGWKQTVDLIKEIEEICEYVAPSAYQMDAGQLACITERPQGFKFFWWMMKGGYRQAIKYLKEKWKHDSQPTRKVLHQIADKMAEHLSSWQQASDGEEGAPPENLASLAEDMDICDSSDKAGQMIHSIGHPALIDRPLSELPERITSLLNHQETLLNLADITELGVKLGSAGFKQIILEAARRRLHTEEALDLARYIWHESLLDQFRLDDRLVRNFKGDSAERTVRQYRQADRRHILSGGARVRRQVATWSIAARNEHPEESMVVQQQANRKRGHIPVRRLLQEAPNVLSALKPCWAMSPLLVAETLPQERLFDVVIFDEASQVTAADAIGPIMRARKVVVTGDTKQLPPTRFFLGSIEEEDEDQDEVPSLTSGFESILDVMATLLSPPHGTRNLSWHYRSRNERLIAFSNAQPTLYDGSLTTFPGTANDECINHVMTEYDPGGTGKQTTEAGRVVELILEHARLRPHESLGVITMGIKHADLIEEMLRMERRDHPELDDWLDRGPDHLSDSEPLFIKNIERVQGDERDAVILSVGYGRGADGRMAHRFGPMNMEGGERRLNVAVTRARRRMTVVSSFTSADLDPNKLRAEGARMLRDYLAYAESGGGDLGAVRAGKIPLNQFERDIQKGLQEAGIPLVAQYGSAGYWIDFAAAHPEKRGRMVLAIEADGARYHSSRTARDRDRLRQEHLERIGWRFHRIWSTDWFLHREREIERTVRAWEEAVAAESEPEPPPAPPPPRSDTVAENSRPAPQRKGSRPVSQGMSIGEYEPEELVALIRWIESDGRLRTDRDLLDIAVKELGFSRKGSRITAALEEAIRATRPLQ